MARLVKISEAAALALHVMVLMAGRRGKPISTAAAASRLSVSDAHLSKVLQRLSKAGLVDSIRGPRGGFVLGRSPGRITLLDVYETIEGRHGESGCLFDSPGCGAPRCILNGLLAKVNARLVAYLSGTRLSALANLYPAEDGDEEKNNKN